MSQSGYGVAGGNIASRCATKGVCSSNDAIVSLWEWAGYRKKTGTERPPAVSDGWYGDGCDDGDVVGRMLRSYRDVTMCPGKKV